MEVELVFNLILLEGLFFRLRQRESLFGTRVVSRPRSALDCLYTSRVRTQNRAVSAGKERSFLFGVTRKRLGLPTDNSSTGSGCLLAKVPKHDVDEVPFHRFQMHGVGFSASKAPPALVGEFFWLARLKLPVQMGAPSSGPFLAFLSRTI